MVTQVPPLSSVCILVTRPQYQCEALIAQLDTLGAQSICFPVIEIKPRLSVKDNIEKILRLHEYQMVIFISQNAVRHGLQLLDSQNINLNVPIVAAIGWSTANLLKSHTITVTACPSIPNSRALLEMDVVKRIAVGSHILIFRGKGGKETLAQGLRTSGMQVDYAEVYERVKPQNAELSFTTQTPDVIMVTSKDSLQNLYEMTCQTDHKQLLSTPLILGSDSMLLLYKQLGFQHAAIIAKSPLDADMITAAIDWQQARDMRSV